MQHLPGRETVAAGVWVTRGSAHESDDRSGATHLKMEKQDEDHEKRVRNPPRRLEISRDERFISQRSQQRNEPGLNDGSQRHAKNGNQAHELVRDDIAPQAAVNDAGLGIDAGTHVTQPDR